MTILPLRASLSKGSDPGLLNCDFAAKSLGGTFQMLDIFKSSSEDGCLAHFCSPVFLSIVSLSDSSPSSPDLDSAGDLLHRGRIP